MTSISDEQRKAIAKGEIPLLLDDSETGNSYVLLTSDQYAKVKRLLERIDSKGGQLSDGRSEGESFGESVTFGGSTSIGGSSHSDGDSWGRGYSDTRSRDHQRDE